MKKIAAIYIRVSTDMQVEEGYSIDLSSGKDTITYGSCAQLPTSARRTRHPSPAKPDEDASD